MGNRCRLQEAFVILLRSSSKILNTIAQTIGSRGVFKVKIWLTLEETAYLHSHLTVFNVLWREDSQVLWLLTVKFSSFFIAYIFSYSNSRERFWPTSNLWRSAVDWVNKKRRVVSHFSTGIDEDSGLYLAQNCLKIIVEVMNFVANSYILSKLQMTIFLGRTKYVLMAFNSDYEFAVQFAADSRKRSEFPRQCLRALASIFPWLNIPIQGFVLQALLSVPSPWHWAPPLVGTGFVQVLVLVWVPPPQDFEHVVQLP